MLSTLGKGAIIRIGADAGISGASIAASIAVEIGERSQIGSGAMLWDTDFHPLDPDLRRAHRTAGAAQAPIRVGCDVFIGARAIVLKGVTIGDGAVVGAGAVVAADVPPGALVAGNPARVIRDVVRGGSRPLRPLET
jgi:acetyltransferase-like isoleucine patch superfamily enzyme